MADQGRLDFEKELGLEFRIDDFIRRHMSDLEVPGTTKRPIIQEKRRINEVSDVQNQSKYSFQKPADSHGSDRLNFERFSQYMKDEEPKSLPESESRENESNSDEPKLSDLERYRPPLALLQPVQKEEKSVSLSAISPDSDESAVRLEETQELLEPEKRPEVIKRNVHDLPDIPPCLFILGPGGFFLTVHNDESDYSHSLSQGNLSDQIRSLPDLRNLSFFPGPLDDRTSLPMLFKYCNERGKDSPVWEVLKYQLTIPCSLFSTVPDSLEDVEKLKGARNGVFSLLQSLSKTHKPPYSPLYVTEPSPENLEENAGLIKEGKLSEALNQAIATRLLKDESSFQRTVSAYSLHTFTRGSSLYVLGMLLGGNIGNLLVTQDACEEWAESVSTVLNNLALIGTDSALTFMRSLTEMLIFRVSSIVRGTGNPPLFVRS